MGHPAHYHNVKFVARDLHDQGHKIIFVARAKDVLFQLLNGIPYKTIYLKGRNSSSKAGLIWSVFKREIRMLGICLKYKPTILIGTDIVITHVAKLLGKKSIVINEDDAKEVPFLAKYGFKYSTKTLSPHCCNITPYEDKKIGYLGYHELAYLHPDFFQPNSSKIDQLKVPGDYFILRFAQLNAHHDDGRTGITDTLALKVIDKLTQFGTVFISSERKLATKLEPYRIQIDPRDIHDVMWGAKMYIGDSQTMAAEAAVLGTPSIRFNDFVGKLGYLEELERRFGLTRGISTDQPERLLSTIDELLSTDDLKESWEKKRQIMLAECDNVHRVWLNLIEDLS